MKHAIATGLLLAVFLAATPAGAQIPLGPPPSPSVLPPPPPAPPPPPRLDIPQVPQMNSPPPFELQNTRPGIVTQDTPPKPILQRQRRGSFSDRVARCLDESAGLGFGPNERAEYSRICANQ